MKARNKIKSAEEMKAICEGARRLGRRIVFTNGCFDLLHRGHVRYLEDAREEGDVLVVGVNTDASVRKIKGPLRPITPAEERAELLAAFHCVDYVVLFDTPDPLSLIEFLQPDILVKGADWPLEGIVGADVVMKAGGKVVRAPLMPDTSTTGIIEKILSRFGGSDPRKSEKAQGDDS